MRCALDSAPPSFREWVESLAEYQRRPLLRRLGNMPEHRRNRMFHCWEAMEEGERRELPAWEEVRGEVARGAGEDPRVAARSLEGVAAAAAARSPEAGLSGQAPDPMD